MAERSGKGKAGGRGPAKGVGAGRAGAGAGEARAPRVTLTAQKPARPAGPARTGTTAKPATKAPPAAPRGSRSASDPKALAAAGPRRPRRRPAADPARIERLVAAAVRSLEDDKAEQVVVLDVTGRASYADRLILATGLADRQIQAMAAHLDEALGREGLKLRRDAIQASDDWVLIDAGDLVIHLFKPEKRAELALEKMWGPDSPPGETPGTPPI